MKIEEFVWKDEKIDKKWDLWSFNELKWIFMSFKVNF